MAILIAGASGLIGRALVASLQRDHSVSVIGRSKHSLQKLFTPNVACYSWDELNTLNAHEQSTLINLCGYNIAAKRWTTVVKQQLIASRVDTSRRLIRWAMEQQAKPHFICANAVGIYGLQSQQDSQSFDEDTLLTPNTPPDFLHEIGMRWQAALQPAEAYGMPVTTTRFGVVLKKNQGMLGKLQLSFSLGLGSIVGDGKQIMSWIHLDDVVRALIFLINQPQLTGPFNLTSPYPIPQAEFARCLAEVMHRPLWLTLPSSLVRLLFGEMGECLLLSGQRVVPKRLLAAGFSFTYPHIKAALLHEYAKEKN